jgi:tetratricopeptide (TPR) repeat protein
MRRLLATAAILFGPLAGPSWARADPPTAASPATETPADRAAALAADGVARFEQGHYEEARQVLAQAFEIDPQTKTLLDLACAESNAGHPVEAVQHFRQYLSRSDTSPDTVDIVRNEWLPRAEAQIARLNVLTPAPANATRRSPRRWIPVLWLEATAVTAAAVAIGFAVAFDRNKADAHNVVQGLGDSACLQPTAYPVQCAHVGSDLNAQRTNGAVANTLFAAAGGLAVLGVVSWFVGPAFQGRPADAVRAVPLIGDRTAGAAILGVW